MNHRRGKGRWIWAIAGTPLMIFLVVPIAALVVRAAPEAVWREFRSDEAWAAVGVSLRTTSISLLILLTMGTFLALGLSGRAFPGKRALEVLLNLPAVLPPSVAGIALLLAFGRSGLFGPWLNRVGIQLPFTAGAVICAQVFVAAPFYVRPVQAALRAIDPLLIEAAELDGATSLSILLRLVIPISRTSIFAAASVAWARALGEFGATILFAGNRSGVTQTMPLAVYLGYQNGLGESIGLSVILLVIAAIVLTIGLKVGNARAEG